MAQLILQNRFVGDSLLGIVLLGVFRVLDVCGVGVCDSARGGNIAPNASAVKDMFLRIFFADARQVRSTW
jgi:hypothetical protein